MIIPCLSRAALARIALLVGMGLLTTPAVMAADVEQTSVAVSSAGLDLATDAGAAAFRQRIAAAARQVCGPARPTPLADHDRYVACRNAAMADATPRVDAEIAAAHLGHGEAMNGAGTSPSP